MPMHEVRQVILGLSPELEKLLGVWIANSTSQPGAGSSVENALIRLETRMDTIMATVADIKKQMADLAVKVQAETDVDNSIVTLLEGIAQQNKDLAQQLKDAIANGADPAELNAIADTATAIGQGIDSNVAKLSAAVTANTTPPATPPVTTQLRK